MLTFDLGPRGILGEHDVHRPLLERAVAVAVVLLDEAARHLVDEHLGCCVGSRSSTSLSQFEKGSENGSHCALIFHGSTNLLSGMYQSADNTCGAINTAHCFQHTRWVGYSEERRTRVSCCRSVSTVEGTRKKSRAVRGSCCLCERCCVSGGCEPVSEREVGVAGGFISESLPGGTAGGSHVLPGQCRSSGSARPCQWGTPRSRATGQSRPGSPSAAPVATPRSLSLSYSLSGARATAQCSVLRAQQMPWNFLPPGMCRARLPSGI